MLMELNDLVPHTVVLAGDGLGIFSGLGDVSNIKISEDNLVVAPGIGKGFLTPVMGLSRFLDFSILSLVNLNSQF